MSMKGREAKISLPGSLLSSYTSNTVQTFTRTLNMKVTLFPLLPNIPHHDHDRGTLLLLKRQRSSWKMLQHSWWQIIHVCRGTSVLLPQASHGTTSLHTHNFIRVNQILHIKISPEVNIQKTTGSPQPTNLSPPLQTTPIHIPTQNSLSNPATSSTTTPTHPINLLRPHQRELERVTLNSTPHPRRPQCSSAPRRSEWFKKKTQPPTKKTTRESDEFRRAALIRNSCTNKVNAIQSIAIDSSEGGGGRVEDVVDVDMDPLAWYLPRSSGHSSGSTTYVPFWGVW